MTKDAYADAIKAAAISMGAGGIEAYLISQAPFLAWPGVRQIVSALAEWILTIAVRKTEMAVFFTYVDFRTSQQGRDFFAAAVAHRDAKTPQGKADAEKVLKDKFRALVMLTN